MTPPSQVFEGGLFSFPLYTKNALSLNIAENWRVLYSSRRIL